MNTFFWLSFFFSAHPVQTCPARGTPMLELDHRADTKIETSTVKIYNSGAWTFTPIDKDGVAGATTRGCFDQKTLTQIRRAVQRAPWEITHPKIMCFAYSPQFTQYLLHGQLMFTQRMCGGDQVDDTTRKALDLVNAKLALVLPHTDAPVR